MKEQNKLTNILLSSDELKDIQNEINELEIKKKELEKKIRISNMMGQFIKEIVTEGRIVNDGKDCVIKIEIEEDFCYYTKGSDIDRIKTVKNAYQKEDDCEILKKILEDYGFKYYFDVERKNTPNYYFNDSATYEHIIITQKLLIPLSKYEKLIKDLGLNIEIDDKGKTYFKTLN